MVLVKAQKTDAVRIMEIIDMAKEHLKEQGINQWQDGYPNIERIYQDIDDKKGYVLKIEDKILAYTLIDFDGDPDYKEIRGCWQTPEKYTTLHRVAISSEHRGQGLSQKIYKFAEQISVENGIFAMRIDTHEINIKMRNSIEKNGFVYRGEVKVNGNPRVGYDKMINNQ